MSRAGPDTVVLSEFPTLHAGWRAAPELRERNVERRLATFWKVANKVGVAPVEVDGASGCPRPWTTSGGEDQPSSCSRFDIDQ